MTGKWLPLGRLLTGAGSTDWSTPETILAERRLAFLDALEEGARHVLDELRDEVLPVLRHRRLAGMLRLWARRHHLDARWIRRAALGYVHDVGGRS